MLTFIRPLILLAVMVATGARQAGAQFLTDYRVQALTSEHGLPSQAITSIAETSDGFLWVSAGGILARFDGYEFRTYTQTNTPALIRRVTHLYAGLGDTLWIVDEGYAVLAHAGGRFVQVVAPFGVPVGTVVQDGRGNLFGLSSTVWRLDRTGAAHTEVLPRVSLTVPGQVAKRDPAGRIWIIDSAQVLREIGASAALLSPPVIASSPLLIASRSSGAVFAIRDRAHERELVGTDGRVLRSYSSAGGSPTLLDREQRLWMIGAGLDYDLYERGRSSPVARVKPLQPGIMGMMVEGTAGCVWITEFALLKACRMPFRTLRGESSRQYLARGPDGGVLSWDSQGNLVVLNANGTSTPLWAPSAALRFARVFVDRRGRTWWSADIAESQMPRSIDAVTRKRRLPHSGADAFVQPPRDDSQVWYAAGTNIYRVTLPGIGPASVEDSIALGGNATSMAFASDGTLWVTVRRNDLRPQLLRIAGAQVRTIAEGDGFPNTPLRAVLADDDGTVWLGTYGGGLVRFREGKFRTVTDANGLGESIVTSLLDDGAGNLWMGGNRSVHRVARRELGAFLDENARRVNGVTYGRDDGLTSPETSGFPGLRDANDHLWFPTIDGAAVVDPRLALSLDSAPPRIHILRVQTGRDTIERVAEVAKLTAGERRVVVRYTGISNRKSEGVRYEYRIDGVDADWVNAGNAREAVYNSIGPGLHRFRVRAISAGGAPSIGEATMQIEVPPFFQETPTFIALLMVATGVLAVGTLRYRERHLRGRAAALSNAVQERTVKLATALDTMALQAEQLRSLDEAKSRFFANVSHEFRTPLSLIIGPVEDLRDGRSGDLPQAVKHRLAGVHGNARRLLQLVEQLLDVARLESGTLHLSADVRDLVPLLRRMADSFASMADHRGILFSLSCPVGGLRVRYDPDQMEKVISNLVSNALKFTERGGTVELRATSELDGGGCAIVEVADSGPGIAPEFHARVFDRFFQVDDSSRRAHEGTGIGLALVRELVELHAGTVILRSELGKGSVFVVRLPLDAGTGHISVEQDIQPALSNTPTVHEMSPRASTRAVASVDQTTVLVVEDNVELSEYLREHLADRYRVLVALNGVRGLEMAREHVPDLIISDVMMPEMDGQSLCEAVKGDHDIDFIPVVLLTARASRDSRLAGLAGGADDYLTKPVDLPELMVRAENLIASRRRVRERWRAQNQQLPCISVPVKAPARDASERALLDSLTTVWSEHLGDENFNVEKMAAAMGMARSTLYRRLEPLLGKSPLDALQEYRLAQSAQWLAETSITVSEVAYGVGFKSVPHFCRRFRDQYDETPSAYRRAHGAAPRP